MGTISSAINVNRTQALKLSMPKQWAQSRQLSMSTRTQALKLSLPNQWAQYGQLSKSIRIQARKLQMPTLGKIAATINVNM